MKEAKLYVYEKSMTDLIKHCLPLVSPIHLASYVELNMTYKTFSHKTSSSICAPSIRSKNLILKLIYTSFFSIQLVLQPPVASVIVQFIQS